MRKRTMYSTPTLELHALELQQTRVCQLLYQEFDARMAYTCTYILPEARGYHRDNERSKRASELNLIHALLPLQLGMTICYQYESAYFPVPYADNQPLCSLCGPKRSHAFNSALQTQQPGLAVDRPTFAISPQEYTKNDLRRSEIQIFPGGGRAPRPP